MAKAYWVVCYRSISDPAALNEYAELAAPAILAGGGAFSPAAAPPRLMTPASINALYWSSSIASPRRSPPTTAPATRPHSVSWAMRWSATCASSKASATERARQHAARVFP